MCFLRRTGSVDGDDLPGKSIAAIRGMECGRILLLFAPGKTRYLDPPRDKSIATNGGNGLTHKYVLFAPGKTRSSYN